MTHGPPGAGSRGCRSGRRGRRDFEFVFVLAAAAAACLLLSASRPSVSGPGRRETALFEGEDPAVSPDGSNLAFRLWTGSNSEIFVARLDRSTPPVRITDDPGNDHSPCWAPDSARICFVSTRSGNRDLWVVDRRRPAEAKRLTRNPEPDEDPAWSPDGAFIAYCARQGQRSDLFVIPSGGGEPVRLTDDPYDDGHPTWSRDSRRIAFVSDRQDARNIYMLDVGALSEKHRAPADRFASGAPYGFHQLTGGFHDDADPAWCPAADLVAFSSDRKSDIPEDPRQRGGRTTARKIFQVSTGPRPLLSTVTSAHGLHEQPAWLPDGRGLVYVKRPLDGGSGASPPPVIHLIEGLRAGGGS